MLCCLYVYTAGKTKCLSKFGDCVVKHGTSSATGLSMVVSGMGALRRNFPELHYIKLFAVVGVCH